MRTYRSDFVVLTAILLIAGLPCTATAADEAKAEPSKAQEIKQDIKDGARQAGREVRETARDAGREVKQAAKDTKSGVKSGWHEFKEGAADFGRSVKGFFRGLFRD